jgi:hypothetical protein
MASLPRARVTIGPLPAFSSHTCVVPYAHRPQRPQPDPAIYEELVRRRRRAQLTARRIVEGRSG